MERKCALKGTHVQVALLQIHRSPNFWLNLEEFDPDRFSSIEGNCDWWQTFGTGQRGCIGMGMSKFIL